ncbi:hypothetical protein NQ318_010994 [Aromia moschata]|uniref:Uncharacterized protein n=1 Tax=Aromia moschata TaxID=1265417 RepID=A0AAV8YME7_9CUCU|nr:hypothetical protein NQ318_010994 [Aromia moschata]
MRKQILCWFVYKVFFVWSSISQSLESIIITSSFYLSRLVYNQPSLTLDAETQTGNINRKQGSGRPRARTEENVKTVTQGRQSINVWCGILNNKIIGPIFFNGSLTGVRYLSFLRNSIANLLDDIPLHELPTLLFIRLIKGCIQLKRRELNASSFRETHPDLPPLNQGTISKIEAQYREMGHVRKVPSKRQAVVDDDTKLNLLLALEENPITPARQLARDSNLNHKTVLKILKYEKKRPYKMQAVQELLEDDPDRRERGASHVARQSNKVGFKWISNYGEQTKEHLRMFNRISGCEGREDVRAQLENKSN